MAEVMQLIHLNFPLDRLDQYPGDGRTHGSCSKDYAVCGKLEVEGP